MKKNEQIKVNEYVENISNDINALLRTSYPSNWHRLYNCKAAWTKAGDWMILCSYSSIVAAYNVNTGEMFDFLRLVYYYTATSAQHIAKFHGFCRSATGHDITIYRWYAV